MNEEPEFDRKAFICPFCNAYANMNWGKLFRESTIKSCDNKNITPKWNEYEKYNLYYSECNHCKKMLIWESHRTNIICDCSFKILNATISNMPSHSEYLPEEFQDLYNEARSVAVLSPKSAAALLRLLIEKILFSLEYKDNSLHDKIKSYINDNSIPKNIENSFKIVRLIGNNSVHEGTIDFGDTATIVSILFFLVNDITDRIYRNKANLDTLNNLLPTVSK